MKLSEFLNVPKFEEFGNPPCSETDPEIFFPQEYIWEGVLISSNYQYESQAKEICNSCPYKMQCLEVAIENGETGIWGGMNETERRRFSRRRKIKISASNSRT